MSTGDSPILEMSSLAHALNLFKNNSTVLWSLSTVDSTSRYIFCNNLFYTYQLMGKYQQKNYQD